MTEQTHCPGCSRHCELEHPQCHRGVEFRQTGKIPQKSREPHPDQYAKMDLETRLIANLRDLGHVVRFLYEGKGSQTGILIRLYEEGEMTQNVLTEKLGIQPGSASEVIGKLDAAGLIRRVPSETDRRTMDIQLTEKGRELAEEAAAKRQDRHQEMFSCLSAEEQETLLALLEKLSADWDSRYGAHEHPHHGPHGRGM